MGWGAEGLRCLFFFSSRRRHTRLQGDWSSDVCSSDLVWSGWSGGSLAARVGTIDARNSPGAARVPGQTVEVFVAGEGGRTLAERRPRSEERRVGKEGRSRWSPYH